MIDLNKYYIAKKYTGPSGAYSSVGGFVPPATSGDAGKFLRGDGDWAIVNTTMSGATFNSEGAEGLVPKPNTGDNRYFLRGDGSWGDPTISQIQYIENSNNIILDVANYSAFVINLSEPTTFIYSGFENGKSINVYLAANHTGYLPHTFPLNTTFSELGDDNIIYSFEGYVTRLLLQNVGNQVINFSSITVKTPSSGYSYYGGSNGGDDPPGVGLDIIELYLSGLLTEFN